jgi:hypothetical protein
MKANGQLMKPALHLVAIRDNPYVYGNPIDNPAMFIGRQNELSEIYAAVVKPNKQDIFIIGERRSGKTSMLYQLLQRIQAPFIPVYVILTEAPAEVKGVVNYIVRKVVMALVKIGVLPADSWKRHRCKDESIIENLKSIIDAARQKLPQVKIVLLMDEADYLLRIDDHLQNMLRAALQSNEVGADLRAVVAGTSNFFTNVVQRSSPLFNHFRFLSLIPLGVAETEELITKPALARNCSFEVHAVQKIRQASGGHPYYCQRVCYEAFTLALKQGSLIITKKFVEEAIKKVIASTSDDAFRGFRTYFWDTANKEEQAFMKRLARVKSGQTKARQTSTRLLDWQIITRDEDTYRFTASLFRDWVKRLERLS